MTAEQFGLCEEIYLTTDPFIVFNFSVECQLDCKNDGFCISPTECQCADGYAGVLCEEGKKG